MTSIQDQESEWLANLREAMSPPPAEQDRIRVRLAAQLAAGTLGWTARADAIPSDLGDAAGHIRPVARGLAGKLTTAGVIAAVGFGGGFVTARGVSVAPSTQPSASTIAPIFLPAPVAPPAPLAPASPPAPSVAIAVESNPPDGRRESEAAAERSAAGEPANSAQTLSEEARELRRADRAARGGMPTLALGILNELDSRIPHGALGEERAAARLIARCGAQDPEAPGAATAWLRRHAQSVYAPRLRSACSLPRVTKKDDPSGQR